MRSIFLRLITNQLVIASGPVGALANEIRQNNNVIGLSVSGNEKTFKIVQLADDMTLFVRTVMSGNTAIKIIKKFEKYSGIQLNENKTKTLWLGTNNWTNTIGNICYGKMFRLSHLVFIFVKIKI